MIDDTLPEPTEPVTVTASAPTLLSGNAITFITDNDPAAFVFSTVPSSWTRSAPQSVTITATGVGGGTMTTFTSAAALTASGAAGSVGLLPLSTGAFVAGVWTGNITMTAAGMNVRITASNGALNGRSNLFNVVQAPLDHFEWDVVAPLQYASAPVLVTLHARDPYGNDVTGYSGTADLSAWRGASSLPITPVVSAAFTDGVWSGTVTLSSTGEGCVLRAADTAGHSGQSSAFEVLGSPLTLLSEPAYTSGTANTLSWIPKGAGIEYEVQRAVAADFSGTVSSGWLTAGTGGHVFGGLNDAMLYFYRARMRRSGQWTSDWSPSVSSTQDSQPPQISLDPAGDVFTAQAAITLHGVTSDATSGVASVTVNGLAASTGNAFAEWTKAIAFLQPGANAVAITASDNAVPANTTTMLCTVQRIATPSADGDGDGVSDLLETAFHLNPAARDASGLPVVSVQTDGGDGKKYLTLQYRRRIQHGGLRYIVETSTALAAGTWSATGTDVQERGAAPTGDGVTELVTLRVIPPTDSVLRKFVRVRVEID